MKQYHHALNPMIECMAYLERYVNSETFHSLWKQFSPKEEDPFLNPNTLKQLDEIKDQMGEVMMAQFPEAQFWFTFLPKTYFSPMKVLLCSFIGSPYRNNDTITEIKTFLNEDSCFFLRRIVENDERYDGKLNGCEEAQLLEYLQQMEFDDQIKWRIFQMHLHLSEILDTWESLLAALMPIYHTYDSLFSDLLQLYEKEFIAGEKDLYQRFSEKMGLTFIENEIDTNILPTIAYGASFMIGEINDSSFQHIYILWGVDILHTAGHLGQSDTTESLCMVLKTLSDKSKFDILCYLSKNKRAYGAQIAKAMKLTTATISYHMQALMDHNLIHVEKQDNRLYYSVNQEKLSEYLHRVEQKILQA